MSFTDMMNQLRHWDNTLARWMLRHVYYMFFQMVLFVLFFFWLFHVLPVMTAIETAPQVEQSSHLEKIFKAQSINTTVITFLLFLNSFWLLYIFSSIQRIGGLLKDLNFTLSRFSRPQREK